MYEKERRQDQRFVVDSVDLLLGNKRVPVIDISNRGARIACGAATLEAGRGKPCTLEFRTASTTETFSIEPHLVRDGGIYIVIGFAPPRADWAEYIRAFDTFHVHELQENIFD